jgi:hypothetical protein
MPYRMLCNVIKREGADPSPDLVFRLFCYVPLHNIRYDIVLLSYFGKETPFVFDFLQVEKIEPFLP